MFEQRLAISTGPNITSDNNSICPHSLIGTQSEIVLTVELTEPHACSGCVQTAVQFNQQNNIDCRFILINDLSTLVLIDRRHHSIDSTAANRCKKSQ